MHLLDSQPAPCSPSERAYFSRRGGRRSTRGGGSGVVRTELQKLEDWIAKNAFAWRRDDAVVVAAGKVTAFGDKVALVSEGAVAPNARSVDPAHAFAQATTAQQVAAGGTSALFNNREALQWTGVNAYQSTLPATNWKGFHNGNAFAIFSPFNISSAPVARAALYASTTGSGPGAFGIGYIGGSMNGQLLKAGGASAYAQTGGAVAVGTPRYYELSGDSTGVTLYRDAVAVAAAVAPNAPSTADPSQSMVIGALDAAASTFGLTGQIPESIFFAKFDATTRTNVYRYFFLRYGR